MGDTTTTIPYDIGTPPLPPTGVTTTVILAAAVWLIVVGWILVRVKVK